MQKGGFNSGANLVTRAEFVFDILENSWRTFLLAVMSDENTNESQDKVNSEVDAMKLEGMSLEVAGDEVTGPKTETQKVDILLKATGNAPIMKRKRWAVDQERKVGWVIEFIKKYLRVDANENVFLYVNQSFAPSPDQVIKNLYDCFGSDGKLVLHYCKTQAWG